MAVTHDDVRALAVDGARLKINRLRAQIGELEMEFKEISRVNQTDLQTRNSRPGPRPGQKAAAARIPARLPKVRRSGISAKGRKAISEAQKKRWETKKAIAAEEQQIAFPGGGDQA